MKIFLLALIGLMRLVFAGKKNNAQNLANNVQRRDGNRGFYGEGEEYRGLYLPQDVKREFEIQRNPNKYGEGMGKK